DDLDGDRPGGLAAPALIERATRNFAATRYAGLAPPDAEVGVILRIGAWVVRGRIDAIFRLPDPGALGGAGSAGALPAVPEAEGPVVELVDWKTGSQVEENPGGLDQLAIYALGLRELGRLPEDRCLVSYCYLGGDEPRIDTRALEPADLDRQRALVEAALSALDKGDYRRACGHPTCETCRRGLVPPPRPTPP
ncbi:MAG TPA: PD-(D/E)XK nuclease family protein, partial [Actinomycetota bacterium]|nr:PD-(D/E)XK nuclease family protein [Actinomycetota bacterium]